MRVCERARALRRVCHRVVGGGDGGEKHELAAPRLTPPIWLRSSSRDLWGAYTFKFFYDAE